MSKLHNDIYCSESGRSMVEMLGVLAIMGLLSVAGVAGYKNAINKHQANNIIEEAQRRAVLVAAQMQLHHNLTPTLDVDNSLGYANFGSDVITNQNSELKDQFGIKVTNVSKPVCRKILSMIKDNTQIRRLSYNDSVPFAIPDCESEENSFWVIYNNDLSTGIRPVDYNGKADKCDEKGFTYCTYNNLCIERGGRECCNNHGSFVSGACACDEGYSAESNDNCARPVCALNEDLSSGCFCPNQRDTSNGVCGNCTAGSTAQPLVTSENHGSVTASSQYGDRSDICDYSNHPAWCILDGNTSAATSKWFTTSTTANIVWHLPSAYKIDSATFYTTNESGYLNRFPTSITISGSNNNSSWTPIGSKTGIAPLSANGYLKINCDSDSAYTYLKFDFVNTNSGTTGIAIAEVKLDTQRDYVLNEDLTCK